MTATRVKLATEFLPILNGFVWVAYDANAFASDSCLKTYGEGRDPQEAEANFFQLLREKEDLASLPEVIYGN